MRIACACILLVSCTHFRRHNVDTGGRHSAHPARHPPAAGSRTATLAWRHAVTCAAALPGSPAPGCISPRSSPGPSPPLQQRRVSEGRSRRGNARDGPARSCFAGAARRTRPPLRSPGRRRLADTRTHTHTHGPPPSSGAARPAALVWQPARPPARASRAVGRRARCCCSSPTRSPSGECLETTAARRAGGPRPRRGRRAPARGSSGAARSAPRTRPNPRTRRVGCRSPPPCHLPNQHILVRELSGKQRLSIRTEFM